MNWTKVLGVLVVRWLLPLTVLLLGAAASQAHNRSESFSEWNWQGEELSYSFSVLQREVTRIPGAGTTTAQLADAIESYLTEHMQISTATGHCSILQPPTSLPSRGGFLKVEGSFACPDSQLPQLKLSMFFEFVAAHTHYAKIRNTAAEDNNIRISELLFTKGQQSHTLLSDSKQQLSMWQAFSQYLIVGAEHIVGGIDHLAFLMALLLLASGWREIAWLVTGFTVGHSLSIVIAVLGFAKPNSIMVEALIGYTIALVVIEAMAEKSRALIPMSTWLPALCALILLPVWWQTQSWSLIVGVVGIGVFSLCYFQVLAGSSHFWLRMMITLVFGAIHGFGFAGGLLETGFPADKIAIVLLGFNLGVELGQLLVLALVLLIWYLLKSRLSLSARQNLSQFAVFSLSGLGVFWFVSRLLA